MKHLFFSILLLFSLAAKSQCDTMTSATFTAITTNSVNVSFTVSGSNWTSFNVTLYDSVTSAVVFNNASLSATSFTATGLSANKVYGLRTYTNVPFGGCEPYVLFPTFRTLGNIGYTPMNGNGYLYKRIAVDSTFHVPYQDTGLYKGLLRAGAIVYRSQDSSLWGYNGANWDAYAKKTYVDTKPTFGDVRDEIGDSLQNFVRLQTQAPTSTLTGGFTYERQPTGNYTVTLDWTAGRQAATPSAAATATLSTIVVDGVSQTFSQPAAGASVSGTKSVTFAKNTNITYANSVTTSDGKSAVSYTSFTVYDKRYIGWAATSTPTDAEIRAAIAQDNSGGSGNYSATLPQLGSALYLFYANTITANSVTLNGFPSTADFTLNVSRSFTNSFGGTTTYYVTTSNAPTGNVSSSTVTFN